MDALTLKHFFVALLWFLLESFYHVKKEKRESVCDHSDLSCHSLLVFCDSNWIIGNYKVGLMGDYFHLCLWRVCIGFWSMILVVRKKIIWCIDRIVLFCVLFWWLGTIFCGRWGMFPGGSLVWIQSRLFIWVLVVWLLVYVMLLDLRLGYWIWWYRLLTLHFVLFGFCESIGLAEVSRDFI